MQELIVGLLVILSVYLGYRMGKGDKLDMPIRKMRFSVRNDAQEKEVQNKLEKTRVRNG